MPLLRTTYALAKQVPDMARGFAIATNYGEIRVEPGPEADSIIETVRLALEAQLAALAPKKPTQ